MSETRFFDFLVKQRNTLMYGVLGLVMIAGGVYRMGSTRRVGRLNDFVQAEAEAAALHGPQSREAIAKLQKILNRHHELHQKYDGMLAQACISGEDATLGRTFAEPIVRRTGDSVYAQFGTTSLLIAEGKHEEALTQTLDLQSVLNASVDRAKAHGSLLRMHNMVRIALLNQELGQLEAEHSAWKAVLSSLESGTAAERDARDQLLSQFREGDLTLVDYAKVRLQGASG